jgi:hypothetical protein
MFMSCLDQVALMLTGNVLAVIGALLVAWFTTKRQLANAQRQSREGVRREVYAGAVRVGFLICEYALWSVRKHLWGRYWYRVKNTGVENDLYLYNIREKETYEVKCAEAIGEMRGRLHLLETSFPGEAALFAKRDEVLKIRVPSYDNDQLSKEGEAVKGMTLQEWRKSKIKEYEDRIEREVRLPIDEFTAALGELLTTVQE